MCAAIGDSACGTHTLKVEERTKFDEASTFLKNERDASTFIPASREESACFLGPGNNWFVNCALPSKEKRKILERKKRWRTNLILLLKNHSIFCCCDMIESNGYFYFLKEMLLKCLLKVQRQNKRYKTLKYNCFYINFINYFLF